MNSTQRRRGIRFPWQSEGEQSTASGASEAGSEAMAVPEKDVRGVLQRADAGAATEDAATTEEAATAGEATATAEAAASDQPQVPEDFMRDLVEAMRRVAEQQRDDAIEQLRATVAEQTAGVRTAAETRAAELRDRAEAEITMISEWEQVEIQRVRDEAVSNTARRRERLDQDLAASNAESEAAQAAADRVIASYQHAMDEFFEKLGATADPVAFASAAMHMPQPPAMAPTPDATEPARPVEAVPWPDESASATAQPAAAAKPEVTTAKAVSAVPAVPIAPAEPATEAATEPVALTEPMKEEAAAAEAATAEAAAAEAAAAEAPAAVAPVEVAAATEAPATVEVSTQIVVTGLTSFGAITSFKQSLEHVDGVRRVSLGLGAGGEFIFTAVHPEGFDLSAAIRTFESGAEFHVVEDRLSVTVGAAV